MKNDIWWCGELLLRTEHVRRKRRDKAGSWRGVRSLVDVYDTPWQHEDWATTDDG